MKLMKPVYPTRSSVDSWKLKPPNVGDFKLHTDARLGYGGTTRTKHVWLTCFPEISSLDKSEVLLEHELQDIDYHSDSK